MKKALLLFTFFTVLLSADEITAHAQFWKKIFNKEEKKPVGKPVKRPATGSNIITKTPAKKKSAEPPKLAATIIKTRYRIDILAPLYLNELVIKGKPVYKNHLPDKVLPGLNFYQGIKLAIDTLNTLGFKLDVYFHDIADPAKTVDLLLKESRLDTADLIIGSVQAQHVASLAAFAKKRNINFVSTLTPADGSVRGNLYFNLLQPTLPQHCEILKNVVGRKGRTANILVYRRNTMPVDEQCFKAITKDSAFSYAKVMMNTMMPADKLRNFLDSNMENVIVMPIVDVAYATQLIEQLAKSFPKYRFEVYGMPSWKGIGSLRKEGVWSNVGITLGSPFYFDPSTNAGRAFSESFTKMFGGKPGEMAYRGYETLYWYAHLLKRYGTVFNEHFHDNVPAPFTRFDLRLATDKDNLPEYFENQHVYLYRYQGGSFSVTP